MHNNRVDQQWTVGRWLQKIDSKLISVVHRDRKSIRYPAINYPPQATEARDYRLQLALSE